MRFNFKILLLLILILPAPTYWAQQRIDIDAYKRTALSHMQAGRYGEAIDQLNKYISATPEESDGYNLRALWFVKRQEYQNAVLDYRRAIALETRSASKRA